LTIDWAARFNPLKERKQFKKEKYTKYISVISFYYNGYDALYNYFTRHKQVLIESII